MQCTWNPAEIAALRDRAGPVDDRLLQAALNGPQALVSRPTTPPACIRRCWKFQFTSFALRGLYNYGILSAIKSRLMATRRGALRLKCARWQTNNCASSAGVRLAGLRSTYGCVLDLTARSNRWEGLGGHNIICSPGPTLLMPHCTV